MKLLAREDGLHYHKNLNCSMVDNGYKIITEGEGIKRKLLPCPYCYSNTIEEIIKKDKMKIDENTITDSIYIAYASGTGILFGIPSDCRQAVKTIVRLTIEAIKENE